MVDPVCADREDHRRAGEKRHQLDERLPIPWSDQHFCDVRGENGQPCAAGKQETEQEDRIESQLFVRAALAAIVVSTNHQWKPGRSDRVSPSCSVLETSTTPAA